MEDILFEQYYEQIMNEQVVRMANIEYAIPYLEKFQSRNKDIIMIKERIKQYFLLKKNINKFKKNMLFQYKILKKELDGIENALKEIDEINA